MSVPPSDTRLAPPKLAVPLKLPATMVFPLPSTASE
jgi:hypothetical protein